MGPVRATIQYDGYMELREFAHLFGLDAATIRRRLHAQGRSLYAYPSDKRLRMVKEADAAAIFQIFPAAQRRRDDGTSKG